jgi:hypothetical protein
VLIIGILVIVLFGHDAGDAKKPISWAAKKSKKKKKTPQYIITYGQVAHES